MSEKPPSDADGADRAGPATTEREATRADGDSVTRPWRDPSYPQLLLGTLVAVTAIALLLAMTTSAAAFGLFNPSWEGASELRTVADEADVEPTVVRNVSRYDTAGEGAVAVVLAPDRPYSEAEASRMRAFVERGGTLVVAEDVGENGNRLLADLNVSTRVNGTLLYDERYNYRSPAMPLARNVSREPAGEAANQSGPAANRSLTEGVQRLTLNHGTVVDPATLPGNATVLVRSSRYAYLDRNGNASLDENETLASRAVATAQPVGDGRIIVVSDPSVFINAMLERPGNRQFATNLITGTDRLLLDYSHAGSLPPLTAVLLTVRDVPLLQVGVTGLALGLVAVWGTGRFGSLGSLLRRLWRFGRRDRQALDAPGATDREALVAYLARQHPEWDRERLERVAQSTSPDRQEE